MEIPDASRARVLDAGGRGAETVAGDPPPPGRIRQGAQGAQVARGVRGALPPGPLTTAEIAVAVPDPADRARYRRIWHGMYRREDQRDDLSMRSVALARDLCLSSNAAARGKQAKTCVACSHANP